MAGEDEAKDLGEKAKVWISALAEAWTALLEVLHARTLVEMDKLELEKQREARQAREDLEFRLLYEARTMEFQAIAMRLGDMVEKQYHTVR
jgi:hypothetical protein